MRDKFVLTSKLLNWFPGHMLKGMRQMQNQLKNVDCILEVHDARIPFTGRNSEFKSMLTAIKPHVLVLNKMDLADLRKKHEIEKRLIARGVNKVLWTNNSGNCGVKQSGYDQILPTVISLMRNAERFNRADSVGFNLMIIGIPNVGKSCLINRMRQYHLKRKGEATKVGCEAGVTKCVLERIKICYNPPIFLYDTPGVMEPKTVGPEETLKLALCSTLSDEVIGIEVIADYLLFWLNKREYFSYVDHFHFDQPIDDVAELLIKISIHNKLFKQVRQPGAGKTLQMRPNLKAAAVHFVKTFRSGSLGCFLLDDNILQVPDTPRRVRSNEIYK